jgi:hypothetical protein
MRAWIRKNKAAVFLAMAIGGVPFLIEWFGDYPPWCLRLSELMAGYR